MSARVWAVGDSVRHATRPEWGHGKISKAEAAVHEGRACQRLTINFERAGLKTLSTAFAELQPSSSAPRLMPVPEHDPLESDNVPARSGRRGTKATNPGTEFPASDGEGSPVTSAPSDVSDVFGTKSESIGDVLSRLPDAATDPFRTLEARLKATLALYRFQPTGASLLDWAASQTGLADPLSRLNRHELEAQFQRFKVRLDAHLASLARDAGKADPGLLARLKADAPSPARSALDRLNTRR